MTLKKKTFGNIVGKGENAVNQHCVFFSTVFLISTGLNLQVYRNESILFCRLQKLWVLIFLKIWHLVKSDRNQPIVCLGFYALGLN